MTNCLRCGLLHPNLFDTAEYLLVSVFFCFVSLLRVCVSVSVCCLLLFTFIINNHNQSILHVRFLLLCFRIGLVTFHFILPFLKVSLHSFFTFFFPIIHSQHCFFPKFFHSTRIAWFIVLGGGLHAHIERISAQHKTTMVVHFPILAPLFASF